MYAFQYTRAGSVEEAGKALAADGDARLLAGGQSLVASMKLRLSKPSDLIDMGRIADQRHTRGDERARNRQPKRIRTARADSPQIAEMQAKAFLKFGVEFVVGQRNDAFGLARRDVEEQRVEAAHVLQHAHPAFALLAQRRD